MHWPWIMDNFWPCCFSNCCFLSLYVRHSLSCSTLASPSRFMVVVCWILYSDSTVSLFRIAKYILDLADMVGSPSMVWSSRNLFWNCRTYDERYYDWFLLLVTNWCSSYTYWVCSVLVIIIVFLLCNLFIIHYVLNSPMQISFYLLVSFSHSQRHGFLGRYTVSYV